MAFRRTTDKTFKADVRVPVVQQDGTHEINTFKAIWEHATTTEQEELRQLTDRQLIEKKLKGWELTDAETKEDVPYTPENLAAVLLIPPTPHQLALSFWEQINGARAKNL